MAGKVSFARKDTVETSLNFGEGWGKIVDIRSVVHQFPANSTTGVQSDPGTMIEMKIQRMTPDGKPTTDDPIEEFFGCGKLEKFHPGVVNDADDDEVEDQGSEVGAEGNCLWSDGSALNRRSKWVMFLASLEEAGFKPNILGKGFLPDIVGLEGFFHSVKLPKDADRTYKRDPEVLVVKQISKFPYDKAKAGAGAGKGTSAPAAGAGAGAGSGKGGKAASKDSAAAPAASSEGDSDGNAEVGMLGVQILQEIAKKMPGQELDKAKIPAKLFTILAKGVAGGDPVRTELHKPVQDLFKSEEWLAETCAEMEFPFANGKISFPKAA